MGFTLSRSGLFRWYSAKKNISCHVPYISFFLNLIRCNSFWKTTNNLHCLTTFLLVRAAIWIHNESHLITVYDFNIHQLNIRMNSSQLWRPRWKSINRKQFRGIAKISNDRFLIRPEPSACAISRHFWNFRPSFLVSRKIANCAAPAGVKKRKYTRVRILRLFDRAPVWIIHDPASTFVCVRRRKAFFLCTFQFCRKVTARLPTSLRTSRQALFIGRRSSLIIVNPRISPARENIPPALSF